MFSGLTFFGVWIWCLMFAMRIWVLVVDLMAVDLLRVVGYLLLIMPGCLC